MVSIRQDMLTAAGLTLSRLGDRRGPLVGFVLDRSCDDGGFADRRGGSDLYYTVFGVECLRALGEEPPEAVAGYVDRFGCGDGLDLVHLACLIRLRAGLGAVDDGRRAELIDRVDRHRSRGGYALTPEAHQPTIYAGFMALSALQDLGARIADPEGLLACVAACRAPDGGFANQAGVPLAMTPTTAAAAVLLAQLGRPVEPATIAWLLARQHASGGFLVAAGAPEPELLSTAVALHALAVAGADLADAAGPAGEFVDGLYCPDGGFRGHVAGDESDCEYTFYGLLALGSLTI